VGTLARRPSINNSYWEDPTMIETTRMHPIGELPPLPGAIYIHRPDLGMRVIEWAEDGTPTAGEPVWSINDNPSFYVNEAHRTSQTLTTAGGRRWRRDSSAMAWFLPARPEDAPPHPGAWITWMPEDAILRSWHERSQVTDTYTSGTRRYTLHRFGALREGMSFVVREEAGRRHYAPERESHTLAEQQLAQIRSGSAW
jgi:hypothetical protein